MRKISQDRRRESIFSRFPILNNVYDYITSHRAYSSVGDLPPKDKIFASDDPQIDSSSLAHVTTEDSDDDGKVDVIRINVAKVSEDLSSFSQDKSRKVEEVIRKAESAPDATEFYEGFEDDLTDYINLLLKFFRIFRHEQIHLEGQNSGGGFLDESSTVAQEDREAEAYYKAYRESLPAIIKNMLKENLTKSSSLNISGSKKMLNNLKKVYASLLEKQEFELAKEAYNLISEFKKTAMNGSGSFDPDYAGLTDPEEERFVDVAVVVLNPRNTQERMEYALGDLIAIKEANEAKEMPSEIIRRMYSNYYPPLLAAKTIANGLKLGESKTDLFMAIRDFKDLIPFSSSNLVNKMSKDLIDVHLKGFLDQMEQDDLNIMLEEFRQEDPSGFAEALPLIKEVDPDVFNSIPTSIKEEAGIIKEESASSEIKKEASAKVSFKDIQNEFTIFTRNTSLKTYGR